MTRLRAVGHSRGRSSVSGLLGSLDCHLDTGISTRRFERLDDGRLSLIEKFQWLNRPTDLVIDGAIVPACHGRRFRLSSLQAV
jgi:hypothetical protein